jgi:hypothetical protein
MATGNNETKKKREELDMVLHFLPYEVVLHMFRQTQERSSCRSSLLITRAYAQETAQQQRKDARKIQQCSTDQTALRMCRNQELVNFFPCRACMHAASWLCSSARTAVPALAGSLTLIEFHLQTFGLLDTLFGFWKL